MASTINTNFPSINAQRNLVTTGASLSTTMQRLSSGLRVNSAKDDAAGLAISERMNTQVKGLAVAGRNANDGISLAQTAEGALSKVGDMLQRMRELAVQAGNATNSQSDRSALQAEVRQLTAEIDRVAKQTNFNGQKLLNGGFAGAVFQVGADSGENITLGRLVDVRSPQLSNIAYSRELAKVDVSDAPIPSIANYNKEISDGVLSITVGTVSVNLGEIKSANSSQQRLGQVVEAINNKTADTGVVAYMKNTPGTSEYNLVLLSEKLDESKIPLDVVFNGFSFDTTGISGGWEKTPSSYMSALFDAANAIPFASDKFDAVLNKVIANNPSMANALPARGAIDIYKNVPTAGNALMLSWNVDYANNDVGYYRDTFQMRENFIAANPKTDAVVADYINQLNSQFPPYYANPLPIPLMTGADGTRWTEEEVENVVKIITDAEREIGLVSGINMNIFSQKNDQQGIDEVDVSDQSGAWVALKKIDSAISQVGSARATLGAMQSRFENATNNIEIQAESLSAARGRIIDADFAKETANLSRSQILQQAGTAMVAQANQIPQSVLQLLKS